MKILFVFLTLAVSTAYGQDTSLIKKNVDISLNSWHKAATNADFEVYFGLMTDDAIFIGTDATENWTKAQFKRYSKPHFDAGKAWDFTTIERNIYVSNSNPTMAWFDEHLDTQMGVCRGSGIVRQINGIWKVQHYVLSIAVPDENVAALTALKKDWDATHVKKILKKN